MRSIPLWDFADHELRIGLTLVRHHMNLLMNLYDLYIAVVYNLISLPSMVIHTVKPARMFCFCKSLCQQELVMWKGIHPIDFQKRLHNWDVLG